MAVVSMLRRAELARKAVRREALHICLSQESLVSLAVILYSITDLADADHAIRSSACEYLLGGDPFNRHAAAAGLVPESVRELLRRAELLPRTITEAA